MPAEGCSGSSLPDLPIFLIFLLCDFLSVGIGIVFGKMGENCRNLPGEMPRERAATSILQPTHSVVNPHPNTCPQPLFWVLSPQNP